VDTSVQTSALRQMVGVYCYGWGLRIELGLVESGEDVSGNSFRASHHMTQFAVAATNQSALSSDEVSSREMR